MKFYAVTAVLVGGVLALYTGVQLHTQQAEADAPEKVAAVEVPKEAPKPKKRLVFPDDLAPAAQAQPVPDAAAFAPGPDPHPFAVLRPDGTLHPWHADVQEEWQAGRVETTELVLVVGKQKKVFLEKIPFQVGEPISRYEYHLEVSVVEAKTGKLLANQRFKNVPRRVRNKEAYETTHLGRPVPLTTVFRWVSRLSKIGFPDEFDPTPIVTQVDS